MSAISSAVRVWYERPPSVFTGKSSNYAGLDCSLAGLAATFVKNRSTRNMTEIDEEQRDPQAYRAIPPQHGSVAEERRRWLLLAGDCSIPFSRLANLGNNSSLVSAMFGSLS